MKTQFDDIIKGDPYHGKLCTKNNQIGYINLWAFNNSYIFMNLENGKRTIIPLSQIDKKIKVITREEFNILYNQKNYPSDIFKHPSKNHQSYRFIGDESKYTDRQMRYGMIHDFGNKLMGCGTNKIWKSEFCRGMAYLISSYNFYTEIVKDYGTIEKARKSSNFMSVFKKYLIGPGSMYEVKCDEMGLFGDPSISEDEIVNHIKKLDSLPIEYCNSIRDSKVLKNIKEFKYYSNKIV